MKVKNNKRHVIAIFIAFIMIAIIGQKSLATDDTITSTITINSTNVEVTYKVDENNNIINLKCNNSKDITGEMTIPSEIDGKKVTVIGDNAFKGATNITKLIIPNSIEEISFSAFEGCTSLSNVDLGKVKSIGQNTFKDCPKLTTITIPKTLENGPWASQKGPFTGTTKLTTVTLEEGMTAIADRLLQDCTEITNIQIPETVKEIKCYAFSNTGISKIKLPSTEKEIDLSYNVFEGCRNLAEVDLGGITDIGQNAFKDCPKLTTITIPKTLENGPWASQKGPFTGTTKLTTVTLEEGMTVIADRLLQDCTEITDIQIPKTVKNVKFHAFENTGIKEIYLPESIENINSYAFSNCKNLEKITILDNLKSMGTSENKEVVFENHNEKLTIYCYKDTVASEYAIKYNIKYSYLTKPTTDNPDDNNKNDDDNKGDNKPDNSQNKPNNNKPEQDNKDDETTAKKPIPQTGQTAGIITITIIVITLLGFTYIKFRKYKDIK